MAATIRIKRSTGAAAPGTLKTGEIAYAYGAGTDANLGDRLFFGKGDDGNGDATSIVVIGGEYLGNMLDHTPGTLTASSALIADASSKLDNIKIDNIDINGNTISSTDVNGNIVLDPNGSGAVNVSTSRITNVVDPSADQDAATKLYVDTVAGAKYLTFTGDTGTDTVNLTDSSVAISGGTGITTVVTDNVVTVNMDNTSVTVGTTEIALGASSTVLAGLTQIDVDNIRILDNTIASSTGVLYIDPNPIDSDGGDVIIRGNLTVNGLQTTVNSTTVSINDKNLVLADSAANAGEADGAGITVNGPTTAATITYNGSTDAWNLNKDLDLSALSALKIGSETITEALEDHLVTNFFLAGEGIDLTYVDGSNTLTVAAELATVTNPGVANFDSDQMTVTSGLVSVYQLDGGVY